MTIDFLNVGHGDCTVLAHPSGRLSMVDIANASTPEGDEIPEGPSEREAAALAAAMRTNVLALRLSAALKGWDDYYRALLVDPATWFGATYPGHDLFRYIQTHPDMDHMMGLHRFFVTDGVPLFNLWDTDHTKQITETDADASPYSYLDWLVYQLLRAGKRRDASGNWVDSHKVLRLHAGEQALYWNQDAITILSPSASRVAAARESEDWNNLSYVLRVDHAGTRVILGGDAEAAAWSDVLKNWSAADLRCDVLKAAHHGRRSGFYEDAVRAMSPQAVICSVGKKPDTDASDAYRRLGAAVFSTRFHGSIRLRIWDDGSGWIENHAGSRIHTLT